LEENKMRKSLFASFALLLVASMVLSAAAARSGERQAQIGLVTDVAA